MKPLEPVVNNFGLTKLHVKLADPLIPWFGHRDIEKQLVLTEKGGGRSFVVTLKTQEHIRPSRRTGTINVAGLDKLTLTEILNQ